MPRPESVAVRPVALRSWTALVTGATALAWLGFFTHNVAELPGQTVLSPESLYPTVVTLILWGLWLTPVTRRTGAWLLAAWAVINAVVGGLLSVLPLSFWPFTPEQSLEHYAVHVVYALTQLPLIWVCLAWRRSETRS